MSDLTPILPTVHAEALPEEEQVLASPWHVVLHNDELHTYEYVIEMVIRLFDKDIETAYRHALEVDTAGVTILATLPKPDAVKKRNAVLRYGGDPRMNTSVSMNASIEPAER